jgi:hypothetical protein
MRLNHRLFGGALVLMVFPCFSSAATSNPTCNKPATKPTGSGGYCDRIQSLIKDTQAALHATDAAGRSVAEQNASDDMDALLSITGNGDAFVNAASPSIQDILGTVISDPNSSFNSAVDAWEKARLDVQTGSTPSSSGSTSLVAKSGLSTLLSAAYEVGAFTQTSSGDTTTFHVNGGGLLNAIGHNAVLASKPPVADNKGKFHDPIFSWDHLDGSVSVDINQQSNGTAAMVTNSANSSTVVPSTVILPSEGGRVGAVSLMYSLRAPFDPRSSKFQHAWATTYQTMKPDVQAAAQQLTSRASTLVGAMPLSVMKPIQDTYRPKLLQDATEANGLQLEADFEAFYEQVLLAAGQQDAAFKDKVVATRIAMAAFASINDKVLDTARAVIGSSFTLEGDFNHPVEQPETYTGRMIYSHPEGKALWTVNGAFTLYGPMQPGSKYQRLRDGQLSAEFDTPLGNPNNDLVTLTGAFYMQYQTDPSVLNITAGNLVPGTTITLPPNAQVLLGPQGLIVIGQGKLTINTKSGIKIPLAVEYSNKTDLLNAADVRGNFGISYDFSSFSTLFGAKPQ